MYYTSPRSELQDAARKRQARVKSAALQYAALQRQRLRKSSQANLAGSDMDDGYDGTPKSEQRVVERYERDTHVMNKVMGIWSRWPGKRAQVSELRLPSGKVITSHREFPRVGAEVRPRRPR